MIEIKQLSKDYGRGSVLENINLTLQKNEIVCLLGPNGAGKSTLLRLLTGYLRPTSGEVLIAGHHVEDSNKQAQSWFGYVPENNPLYPEMSVYEYICYSAQLRCLPQSEFEHNLQDVLQNLQLNEVLTSRIDTLSKGFRHRVGIAGALIHQPRILILDEPTEGLDPNQKAQIHRFIKEYGRGRLIIVSTHIMEEVEAMANRVLLLNKGRLIVDASPSELKKLAPDSSINEAFRLLTGGKQ